MTMRSVQDRFWSDGWVRKLNPLDRYLFLYLLTNEHTNWCGVYELDLGMMAYESGVAERDLERSMLPRLSPKVVYVEGWVWVPNWTKHHMSESGSMSPTQQKGFEAAWKQIPVKIRDLMKEIESGTIPYAYPIGGVSPSSSSSAFSSTYIRATPDVIYEVEEDTKPIKKERTNLEGWATFLEIYPRVVDVERASSFWRKMAKEERELALTDVRTRSWSSDPQFILTVKTYLEGKRWNDKQIVPEKIKSYGKHK